MERDKDNAYIATLTRQNHESWFRRMKYKLQGKGVFYVIESTRHEYAWIKRISAAKETSSKSADTPTISTESTEAKVIQIEDLTSNFERFGGSWNIEKAKEYDQHQAQALSFISRSINDDDTSCLEEYGTAMGVWTYLKTKYEKTNATTANSYMTKI